MGFNVALIGPGELHGQELIRQLAQRRFPVNSLLLLEGPAGFASFRRWTFNGRDLDVREISSRAFRDIDLAFSAAAPNWRCSSPGRRPTTAPSW